MVTSPLLATYGGDSVTVNGTDLGPGGASFPVAARYGFKATQGSHVGWYTTTCVVIVAHTSVACTAVEGSGRDLVWEVRGGDAWRC